MPTVICRHRSTYGNRKHHSFDESKEELLGAIRYSVSQGEKIIIPAFAVERTQEILYILGEFYRKGLIGEIPIYLDSPLAIKATEIFRKNKTYYDKEAQAIVDKGYDPFDMPGLRFTSTTKESIAINQEAGSAIVIAGSGMCTAGRIKHHLKHNLWRKGASIVIVGFQAKGTTGRKMVDGAKKVRIFREDVAVRAKIFTIGGFSAHADREDLLEWVSRFESNPRVFVTHGEPEASSALAKEIQERFNLIAHIPEWKERLILRAKETVFEKAEEAEKLPDVKTAMLNAIVDLERELEIIKRRVNSGELEGKIGEDETDRLEYIKEELQATLA